MHSASEARKLAEDEGRQYIPILDDKKEKVIKVRGKVAADAPAPKLTPDVIQRIFR